MRRSRRALTWVGVFPHTDPRPLVDCGLCLQGRSPFAAALPWRPATQAPAGSGSGGDLCAYARG